jgi:hypothetical protein
MDDVSIGERSELFKAWAEVFRSTLPRARKNKLVRLCFATMDSSKRIKSQKRLDATHSGHSLGEQKLTKSSA